MSADAEDGLRRFAASQHATFTRAQAMAAGFAEKTVDRHIRTGRFVRLYPGVYITNGVEITWKQQLAAALLAGGPSAVASHRSAAMAWGISERAEPPEVTVPAQVRRTHSGIIVHRRGTLEAVGQNGFRVTNANRTLLDLASCLAPLELAEAVDTAHRFGFVHPKPLKKYLTLRGNLTRPGSGVLREIVAARPDEPNDSVLETRFFEALRSCSVPLPATQHPVMTVEGLKYIDYSYPHRLIAIELDSWGFHGTREAFDDDRARKANLVRLGWQVMEFTWKHLVADPTGVAVKVALTIGLVPSRWRQGGDGSSRLR